MFVLIWPGLGEEFFFRGVIQRQLVKTIGNPVTAIVLTSFIFAVSHIPIYIIGYSYSPVRLGSALLPIMFTSFFWGYGYYRTGVLWPWVVIHALSNLVFLDDMENKSAYRNYGSWGIAGALGQVSLPISVLYSGFKVY